MSKENPQGTDLAIKIFKEIEKSGLSDSTIAKRMGESRQTIGRICDRKTFDLDFLQRLKSATGIDYTNYVFNPKTKQHEPLREVTAVAEPEGQYLITLNFSVGCPRDQAGEFSSFLTDMEAVANKYQYVIK